MTALSDLLNDAKGDRSVDQLIQAARDRGVEVSDTARANAYKALKGRHAKNPTDNVLTVWSEIFGVPVTELRKAVGKPAGELGPWVPVSEAGQLSQDIRNALDDLIKAIVKEGGGAHGAAATSEPPGEGGGSVVQLPPRPPAAGPSGIKRAARKTGKPTARERGEDSDAPRPE
ncbi:hypothetical protein [Nocardioides sp. BYT-33-1]|uniref:hypothetical protein n=1 Tax=Nocardioides sp. BYT-33-1 TaxID=3416952 RepID=UPI003F535854